MEMNLDTLITMGVNLITLGAFYGAVKTEITWIKKSIEKLEKSIENIRT